MSPDPQMGAYIAVREGWWPWRGQPFSRTLWGRPGLDGMTLIEPPSPVLNQKTWKGTHVLLLQKKFEEFSGNCQSWPKLLVFLRDGNKLGSGGLTEEKSPRPPNPCVGRRPIKI